MEDNKYLKIWRFFVIDIFEKSPIKKYLTFITMYFIFLLILQTLSFIHKASITYFVQFGPTYFIIVYLILCVLSSNFSSPLVVSSTNYMRSWNVIVNDRWKIQYQRDLRLATIYMWVTLSLGMVTAVFYFLPTQQDKQLFFENDVAETYFPRWQNFVIWFSKVGFLPLTYVSVVQPSLRVIYCWMHIKFHIQNCLFLLKSMDGCCGVEERLKFCLEYHAQITLIFRKILRGVQIYVLPFQVVGTVLIANIVFYYFWFQDVLKDQYLRIFSLGMSAFVILFGLAQNGQAIEDVSSDIFEVLLGVDWCNWSESNKKMYLMFLINTQRQFKIKYSDNISLNYKMGVEMVKTFFSIISVMTRLQK